MAAILRLYAVPLVEQTKTGLWCPKCLKPSGYEIPFAMLWPTGVSIGAALRKCGDCDSPIPEDED